jgi:predicted transcriptional regulator
MKELDRRVIRALLGAAHNQDTLAKVLNADLRAVRDSLARLVKSGLVELHRDGQRRIPRLTLSTAVDRLEQATRELVEATV